MSSFSVLGSASGRALGPALGPAFGPALGIAVVLGAILGTSCANQSESQEKSPPSVRARETCRSAMHESIDEAFEYAENSGPFVLTVRYNPARCDGPDFEVRAHGVWTRAYLDGKRAVRSEIQNYRESTDHSIGSVVRIEGDFRGKRRAETGRKYPMFWVEAFEIEEDVPRESGAGIE